MKDRGKDIQQTFEPGSVDFSIAQNFIDIDITLADLDGAISLANKCGQHMTRSGASMRRSLQVPGLSPEERQKIKNKIRDIEPLYEG